MSREGWLARVKIEEAKIIAAEGHLHVKGRYYAREADASLQRKWEAEVRASRAIARDILRNRGCSWCANPITIEQESVSAAGAEIHRVPCGDEFAQFIGEPVARIEELEVASCPQCSRPITKRDTLVAIGNKNLHESCAESFEAAAFGGAGARYEAAQAVA